MRLLVAALALAFCAVTHAQSIPKGNDNQDEGSMRAQGAAAKTDANLPKQDLSEEILYEYLLAEIAVQRGNAGLAAQAYMDLARRTRDRRIARRAMEIASLGRLPAIALQAAKLWYELEPDSIQALQTISGLLVSAKRVDEAMPFLEKLFAADRGVAASGFLQLGRFLSSNPDRATNLAIVRALAAKHPELAEAHLAVAQAAAGADDEALALAEIRRAAELRPDWELPVLLEARIFQQKSPAQAQARLAAYLEKYPKALEMRLNYARLLVLDNKLTEASGQLQALVDAHPGNAELLYTVALLAAQIKDYDVAEAHLRRLLELEFRDKNAVRYTLGEIAEARKDLPAALDWYAQVEAGEQYMPSRVRTAQILAKQDKLGEARAYLQRVDATNAEQRAQLVIAEAQILREAERSAEAFEVLAQALAAQPDQPDLLYDQALVAEKLDRFDILEANLQKLLQMRPDHAHAYNALGYSLADRNLRLDEAYKLIQKALELAPEDYFIVDSMGWVYYRMGDYARAVEYLRRAYQGRPDGEIGAHLGEVLWVMGSRLEAEQIWDEAVKNHPDNDSLRKTIKRFRP